MTDYQWMGIVRNLGELNHFLYAVEEASDENGVSDISRVSRLYESSSYLGLLTPLDAAAEAAICFRFVVTSGRQYQLTPAGSSFLKKNPNKTFEITDRQREMIVQVLFFSMSELSRQYEKLIGLVRYDPREECYVISPASGSEGLGISELRSLSSAADLLTPIREGAIAFCPGFTKQVAKKLRIMKNPDWMMKPPTDELLEASRHAEKLVFENEKKRLLEMGYTNLAERVELVSEYDSTSGFDIMSFSGETDNSIVPDRYIEVKSSAARDVRFWLTQNELRRAREYCEDYVIVFIGGHAIDKTISDCVVKEIRNPCTELFDVGRYQIDGPRFLVREISRPA